MILRSQIKTLAPNYWPVTIFLFHTLINRYVNYHCLYCSQNHETTTAPLLPKTYLAVSQIYTSPVNAACSDGWEFPRAPDFRDGSHRLRVPM